MIKRYVRIIFINIGLLAAGVAQTNPATGKPPAVAHGVSNQFEQVDGFPVFDTRTISVANGVPYYEPAEITVEVGDVVRWINQPLSDAHTIIDTSGRFSSRAVPAGEAYCHHFIKAGDYDYSCRFHPWMKGVVHVQRRELSLVPISELTDGATVARRAMFLRLNPEAIEDREGGFWLPGAQLTTLEHRTLEQNQGENLIVHGAGGRLVPLVASGDQLMVAMYGELLVIDPSSAKVLQHFQLPQEVNLARGAMFGDGQLWAAADNGKNLVFADTVNKIVRTRMLPDDARIVALRSGTPGTVWALDAGRRMLLKLGADWISEIPLPSTVSNAASLAIDREDHPWFADPHSGVAGTVVSGGQIAEFSIPANETSGLLQISGLLRPLLSISPASEKIAVVDEELGRLSAAQRGPDCENPRGLDIKQKAEVGEPRRPQ
jgi:plastocyanin